MDIIVCVPRSEEEHFWADTPGAAEEFWALGRVPKHLAVGDRIWFKIRDQIVAYATIDRIECSGEDEECASTGRVWRSQCFAYWKVERFRRIDPPITYTGRLMRGYEYAPDYRGNEDNEQQ